jgi:hypothetical protein
MRSGKSGKIFICFLLFGFLLKSWTLFAQQSAQQQKVFDYIDRYKNAAMNEMALFRIPASIKLAQGIIETSAGTSKLATLANNHFGIKCHKGWTGPTYHQDDDEKNECFRKYSDPLESFRDHSHFLTTRDRYKSLFTLKITDYRGWALGLKAAGYATNPKYPELLIKTIENYQLDRYDRIGTLAGKPDTVKASVVALGHEAIMGFKRLEKHPNGRDLFMNNKRKLIIARSDDNVYQIAADFGLSVEKLLIYNDLAFATSLKPGQIVYLEKKRRKACIPAHIFRKDESLYAISQQYGIQLKMIYKRNDLRDLPEPLPGTVLKLR